PDKHPKNIQKSLSKNEIRSVPQNTGCANLFSEIYYIIKSLSHPYRAIPCPQPTHSFSSKNSIPIRSARSQSATSHPMHFMPYCNGSSATPRVSFPWSRPENHLKSAPS